MRHASRGQWVKQKVPVNSQLLNFAEEELKMKKQILERMEATDKEYSGNITKLTNNIERLTNSISDGKSCFHSLDMEA